MAAGAIIGALRVVLGIDTASFETGIQGVQGRMAKVSRSLEAAGAKMAKVGTVLSVGITAPLVGIGSAALSAGRDLAASMVEVNKAAQLANITSVEFQRLSHAARTVGFESEKLADVYKDVNDRVGDFLSTGGGEMKDFFEKVAPKVGLTAEAFRNLSGPQALQLYYNSLIKAGLNQQQVTFYMEAMADEATALVPLLQNNGKAMAELGAQAAIVTPEDAEQLKRYTDAQRQMETALQRVTIALVGSGLLDGLTSFVTKAAEITSRLAEVNPELMQWAFGVAAVAAAVGPALIGFGTLTSVAAQALPKIMAMAAPGALPALAPALLPIAAAATAVYLAYQHWDTIGQYIDGVVSRTQQAATDIDAHLRTIQSRADAFDQRMGIPSKTEFLDWFAERAKQRFAEVDGYFASLQKFADDTDAAIGRFATNFGASLDAAGRHAARLYTEVKTWLVDRLGATFTWVSDKAKAVGDAFFTLYDRVVGHSYIPDMVDEIGEHMRRLDGEMVQPAGKMTAAAAAAFEGLRRRVHGIMAELFPAQAQVTEIENKLADLDKALAGKMISSDAWRTMRERLIAELMAAQEAARKEIGSGREGAFDPDKIPDGMKVPGTIVDGDVVVKESEDMWGRVGKANEGGVASFARTARDIAATLGDLGRSIKSGDWFDALSRVLELGAQVLGKSPPATTTFPIGTGGFGGFRAAGGPVIAGTSYVVGEQGRELFTPKQSGWITPNKDIGRGEQRVHLVVTGEEGPMFRPVVRAEAGSVSVRTVGAASRVQARKSRQALA